MTTTGEQAYAVYRDGRQQSPSGLTHNEAFAWLLRHQGQSVEWATTHEGWEIRAQEYCQPHDIYDCPFAHGAPWNCDANGHIYAAGSCAGCGRSEP